MNDPKGYYATLEVEPSASAEEIKKAYRRKSLQTHPDRSNVKDTTAAFQQVSEAYDVLGDAEKRKQYDQGVSKHSDLGNGMYAHFQHSEGIPQDIFEFFKNGGQWKSKKSLSRLATRNVLKVFNNDRSQN